MHLHQYPRILIATAKKATIYSESKREMTLVSGLWNVAPGRQAGKPECELFLKVALGDGFVRDDSGGAVAREPD